MNISKTIEGSKTIIAIEGWLDVQTTPELSAYMETLEETKELVFDFAKLEYISSMGIREVVATYRRQKSAEGTFKIINVSADVYDVFAMTSIDKKIDIEMAQ